MVVFDFALRVAAALTLGAMIGAERQLRQRMAGLRTNALVSVGASLFVMVSVLEGDSAGHMRIAAQVVSGIGFLGAGVIMREGMTVRGLNTAATLWCSAAIGILCGLGFALEAAIGTGFVLVANLVLRHLAQRINAHGGEAGIETESIYRVTAVCEAEQEILVRNLMLRMISGMPALMLQSLHSEDTAHAGRIEVRADLLTPLSSLGLLEQIVSQVSLEGSVSAVRWALVNNAEFVAERGV
ncbi:MULTISPECIES: MgtC/SapB family protein [unclassified Janthinobacterium]|uniref:MgtC/SapB family protein n=1 Tax=unclassified Janthinobacterium TaxID=2610881 RepID=UPI002712B437|nr:MULTISPECIES: MgtC/SapB family protein [unclassified Janthinobacterium]MDO8066829.1 MgtC/SapB family protein [Janthinobacterium sp. SUN206]MDO8073103.1 MgtC/SapB family protein [Janthinobacterium sp. SUN176]